MDTSAAGDGILQVGPYRNALAAALQPDYQETVLSSSQSVPLQRQGIELRSLQGLRSWVSSV